MKFKFLEHTADQYIEAYGKTLEEAFENCALGLEETMTDTSKVKPKIEKKIEIEAEDDKALLFDFLTQFLIFHDAENMLFSEIKVHKIEEGKLKATAKGEEYDPKRHESKTHVKAITYHEMDIKKEKDKYIVRVLVDI